MRRGGYSRWRIVVDISVNGARYAILLMLVMMPLLSLYIMPVQVFSVSGWNKRTAVQGGIVKYQNLMQDPTGLPHLSTLDK